jgi:regulator of RNase E activity RraA
MLRLKDATMPLPAALWEDLRAASTATLSSVLIRRGLRPTHLRGVFPLRPGACLTGDAVTLRLVSARADQGSPEMLANPEYPQRKVVERIGPGQVLVVDAHDHTAAGVLGAILALPRARRGAAGIVTEGAVRDAAALRALDLPMSATGAHPAQHTTEHIAAEMDVPTGCGGVLVLPGDVIVGDDDGVLVPPRATAAAVAREAREQDERERFVQRRIEARAPITGIYPPNAETRAAFERERARP